MLPTIQALIVALNQIEARVWQIVQFIALLALIAFGAHLIALGNKDTGASIVTGSFALLRFEVGGDK